jgi:hypothetical protein
MREREQGNHFDTGSPIVASWQQIHLSLESLLACLPAQQLHVSVLLGASALALRVIGSLGAGALARQLSWREGTHLSVFAAEDAFVVRAVGLLAGAAGGEAAPGTCLVERNALFVFRVCGLT